MNDLEYLVAPEDVLSTELENVRGGDNPPVIHCNSDGKVYTEEENWCR